MGQPRNSVTNLTRILGSGDLRSAGRTTAIIRQARRSASLRRTLFSLLNHPDRLVRMRVGDVLEKVTVDHPEWLWAYRSILLRAMQQYSDKELRWHLIQLAGRTAWTPLQRHQVIRLLKSWYRSDDSNIVRVFSMQVLFDFGFFPRTELQKAARSTTFSISSRARILLAKS